jgi:hypothetical protein
MLHRCVVASHRQVPFLPQSLDASASVSSIRIASTGNGDSGQVKSVRSYEIWQGNMFPFFKRGPVKRRRYSKQRGMHRCVRHLQIALGIRRFWSVMQRLPAIVTTISPT